MCAKEGPRINLRAPTGYMGVWLHSWCAPSCATPDYRHSYLGLYSIPDSLSAPNLPAHPGEDVHGMSAERTDRFHLLQPGRQNEDAMKQGILDVSTK